MLFCLVFFSCNKEDASVVRLGTDSNSLVSIKNVKTKSNCSQFQVTQDDVVKYIENKRITGKLKETDKVSIKGINDNWGFTSLYYVEYPQGWEILSSDMRTPCVLVHSNKGSFDLNSSHPINSEIQLLASDIAKFSTSMDVSEEMFGNISFWESIRGLGKLELAETRTKSSIEDTDGGRYILESVEITQEPYDTIGHLIQTHWHQRSPYNKWCPYRTDVPNEHCLAGCVAIAGAQMLYFLHNKFGVPQTAPDNAVCAVDFTRHHIRSMWHQSGSSSTIWDEYGTAPYPESILIANVGYYVDMSYSNGGSGAVTEKLSTQCFPHYGISSVFYENLTRPDLAVKIVSSLSSGMPVVAKGHSEAGGHCFIIDRALRVIQTQNCTYKWIPDNEGENLMGHDEYVHTTSQIISIEYIGANWGWDLSNASYDDALFTVLGGWFDLVGEDFSSSRGIITDFSFI